MPKRDVRENDTLTIKVRVTRVSDDGEQVTIDCWGQRVTAPIEYVTNITKHEKGNMWPNG